MLRRLEKVLDYFEEELGHEGRVGRWLGGGQICVADITLGGEARLLSYTLYCLQDCTCTGCISWAWTQLTTKVIQILQRKMMMATYYTDSIAEGVRPHLSVFYQSLKSRTSFKEVLRWQEHEG